MSKRSAWLPQAEILYVQKGKTLEETSNIIDVSISTLSRWKREGKWDERRKEYLKTPLAIADILAKALMDKINALLETGEFSAKDADSVVKIVKSIKSLQQDYDRLGSVILTISDLVNFLKNRDIKIVEKLEPYLMEFMQEEREKYQ